MAVPNSGNGAGAKLQRNPGPAPLKVAQDQRPAGEDVSSLLAGSDRHFPHASHCRQLSLAAGVRLLLGGSLSPSAKPDAQSPPGGETGGRPFSGDLSRPGDGPILQSRRWPRSSGRPESLRGEDGITARPFVEVPGGRRESRRGRLRWRPRRSSGSRTPTARCTPP